MNEQNLRVGQTEIFVNIETKKMTYFSKEVKAVYLRDVSKTVSNHYLNRTIGNKRDQISNFKFNNDNVAHEMRAPLGSIIVFVNLLMKLGNSVVEGKRARDYYQQIKAQA